MWLIVLIERQTHRSYYVTYCTDWEADTWIVLCDSLYWLTALRARHIDRIVWLIVLIYHPERQTHRSYCVTYCTDLPPWEADTWIVLCDSLLLDRRHIYLILAHIVIILGYNKRSNLWQLGQLFQRYQDSEGCLWYILPSTSNMIAPPFIFGFLATENWPTVKLGQV